MGFLSFLSQGLLLGAVERISNKISSTEQYKVLSAKDSKMLREYREFEKNLVSSALAFIILDLDMKNQSHLKDIQTIYIGKNAPFIRKIITGEILTYNLNPDEDKAKYFFKGDLEAQICHEIHSIFEDYVVDVKNALKLKSAMYYWKYNVPRINEFTEEETDGEYRLFNFLVNLLLPEEQLSYDINLGDKLIIGSKSINDTEQSESFFNSFIQELIKISKD